MSGPEPDRVKEVFLAAAQQLPDDRDAFLEAACKGEKELLGRVRMLLSMDSAMPSGFLGTLFSKSGWREGIETLLRFENVPRPFEKDGIVGDDSAADFSSAILFRPDPDCPQPLEFGPRIAKGGMGTILEGADRKLGRNVAVKIMRLEQSASREQQERFLREVAVLALLEHPSIVPIYDLCRDAAGRLYYTMKLVRGSSLQKILDDLRSGDPETLRKFPLETLLEIFRKICDAIGFAHSRGILHRDLKPENVMVGEFGEVQVMDWGLAKILGETAKSGESGEEEKSLPTGLVSGEEGGEPSFAGTLEGSVMGTPKFMSPEQAEGSIDLLDERSDIYSLGAILYAILTLRPPIEGNTLHEVLQNVSSGVITPPTRLLTTTDGKTGSEPGELAEARDIHPLPHIAGRRVPSALSAVAMRALHLERDRRYPNVTTLAEEIERYQNGFATRAEKLGAAGQLALFIKRNRGFSITSGVAAVFIVILTAGFLFKVNHEKNLAAREAANAVAARAEMENERNAARLAEAQAQVGLAEVALANGNRRLVRSYLARVPEALRDDDWHFIHEQTHVDSIPIVGRLDPQIAAICAHPVKPSVFVVWDAKGAMSQVNAKTGERVFEYPNQLEPPGSQLAMTADGRRLAAVQGRKILFIDAETGEIEGEWQGAPNRAISWSHDGRLISTRWGVLDISTGQELWRAAEDEELKEYGYATWFLIHTSEPDQVLEICNSSTALRNARTGEVLKRFMSWLRTGTPVKIPGEDIVVFPMGQGQLDVGLLDLKQTTIRKYSTTVKGIYSAAVSHDRKRILISGQSNDDDATVNVISLDSGRILESKYPKSSGVLFGHPLTGEVLLKQPHVKSSKVLSLSFRNRLPWLTMPNEGGFLQNPIFVGSEAWFLGPTTNRFNFREFKPKGDLVTKRYFWNLDVENDSIQAYHPPHDDFGPYHFRWFYVAEDGHKFASVAWNDHLLLQGLNRETGEIVTLSYVKLDRQPDPRLYSFNSDLTRFWMEGGLWESSTGKLLADLEVPEGNRIENTIWMRGDGSLVGLVKERVPNANLEQSWKVVRWNSETGKTEISRDLPCPVHSLKLSPDGERIALAGADKSVHIISSQSLELIHRLRAHSKAVADVCWHPSRPILVTSSLDLSIKFWNLDDMSLQETVWGINGDAKGLKFSPSGKMLVCQTIDDGLYFYDVRDYLEDPEIPLSEIHGLHQPIPKMEEFPPKPEIHESLLSRRTSVTEWIAGNIDSIDLVEAAVKKDLVPTGGWKITEDGMVAPRSVNSVRFPVPFSSAPSYRITMKFHAIAPHHNCLAVYLPLGDRATTFILDSAPAEGWRTGFRHLDGAEQPAGEYSVQGQRITDERPHELVLTVKRSEPARKARITAELDGTTLVDWEGDPSRLSMASNTPDFPVSQTGMWNYVQQWVVSSFVVERLDPGE